MPTRQRLKELMISELMLDMTADDIGDDTPLFGPAGIGLDSVDALQLVHRTLLGRIVHESWSLQFGMITIDRAHIPPLRRDHRPRGGAQFIGALT